MGAMKDLYNFFIRKSAEKGPLERRRRRWEDNVTMDIRETEWDDVDRMHLVQNRDHGGVL
jgi:hypothetical protein